MERTREVRGRVVLRGRSENDLLLEVDDIITARAWVSLVHHSMANSSSTVARLVGSSTRVDCNADRHCWDTGLRSLMEESRKAANIW